MFTKLLDFLGSLWGKFTSLLSGLWDKVRGFWGFLGSVFGAAMLVVDKLCDFLISLLNSILSGVQTLLNWSPSMVAAAAFNDYFTFANTFFPLSELIAGCVILMGLLAAVAVVRFVFFVRRLCLP